MDRIGYINCIMNRSLLLTQKASLNSVIGVALIFGILYLNTKRRDHEKKFSLNRVSIDSHVNPCEVVIQSTVIHNVVNITERHETSKFTSALPSSANSVQIYPSFLIQLKLPPGTSQSVHHFR